MMGAEIWYSKSRAMLFSRSVCVVIVFVWGCQQEDRPTPGGDVPLTVDALTNVRLTDIREPLSWTFTASTVVIDFKGQPLPADVAHRFGAVESAPMRIESEWQLDVVAHELRLSNVQVDGTRIEDQVVIAISTAGVARLNLGERQYNRFRLPD